MATATDPWSGWFFCWMGIYYKGSAIAVVETFHVWPPDEVCRGT